MKTIATYVVLPLLALCGVISATSIAQVHKGAPTGTLETLIVASGTVSLDLDVSRLNGASAGTTSKMDTVRFQAVDGSYFPVLVFNNELRGVNLGSIALVPGNAPRLPAFLNDALNQLVLEKRPSEEAYELVIRDARTGFVFFNIEGIESSYDASARAFHVTAGRLLVSDGFAKNMGRPAEAGAQVGNISLDAKLRVIESKKVLNGAVESAVLPATDAPTAVPGPDVIVGDLPTVQQVGTASGTQVGIVVATTSCNNGNVELNWFALPNTDHPVIPQNFYRMSGGASNTERFEQIGQSWLKHAFTALQQTVCGTCTSAANGTHLGVGCSDPYAISENQTQSSLGSRAWVNPFTAAFPNTANSHTGHTHNGTSHRTLVESADLNTSLNVGATYFAEGQYVTQHEYAWCQSHPGQCNMYNNVSYRRFNVTGTASPFSFATVAGQATQRMQPAINAWTGATINRIEPEPGVDGQGYVGFKVSGPVAGVYHYEYAVYNQNLDRGIQSFSIPLGCGVSISNLGFHAPANPPSFANDNLAAGGLSNAAWTGNQTATSVTWSSETLAQNANANALRWGTLYNFRFDSTQPPAAMDATIGFFKTGSPITVGVQGPMAQPCNALTLSSAVSRKLHGGVPYDVDLSGVECRTGGANGDHTVIVTFSNTLTSGNAAVTNGTGAVAGSPSISGNTMTINLTGVPVAQQVTVTLTGVTDNFAQTYPDTGLVLKALFGDVGGNGAVSTSDVGEVKAASDPVTAANFRDDVNVSNTISASDISAVKSMAGATLP